MADQTYISFLKDKTGKKVNFERWSYKRLATVIKQLKELYECPIYTKYIAATDYIEIYATPDRIDKEKLVFKEEIKKFMEE